MREDQAHLPVGILVLASIAREEGVTDLQVLNLPIRGEEDKFIKRLSGSNIVGFSSICTTYPQTLVLAKVVKESMPKAKIVMGGPQATTTAAETMSLFNQIDIIFKGEADVSWRQYIQTELNNKDIDLQQIPGIVWRKNWKVIESEPPQIIEDIDSTSIPAFDLYPAMAGKSEVSVEIGRGCPFSCTFCSTNTFFKRRYRTKSPERIIKELNIMNRLYENQKFHFIHDSFVVNKHITEAVCDALRQHPKQYQWNCSARADQVNVRTLELLKSSGCKGIYFGIETGSDKMQKAIKKNLRVKDAMATVNMAKDMGFHVTTSFIMGFPNESTDDLKQTLDVYLHLKAKGHRFVQLHILAPLLGSELAANNERVNFDEEGSDFSESDYSFNAQEKEMVSLHKRLFMNFYHYENPSISRKRYIFIYRMLNMACLYFGNFLKFISKENRQEFCHWLLNCEIPADWSKKLNVFDSDACDVTQVYQTLKSFSDISDDKMLGALLDFDWKYEMVRSSKTANVAFVKRAPAYLDPLVKKSEAMNAMFSFVIQRCGQQVEVLRLPMDYAEILNNAIAGNELIETGPFLNYTVKSATERIMLDDKDIFEICGSCAECCMIGNIVCSRTEWEVIRDYLVSQGKPIPDMDTFSGELLISKTNKYLLDIDGKKIIFDALPEAARKAKEHNVEYKIICSELEYENDIWKCQIQPCKPIGCRCFPFLLLAEEIKPNKTEDFNILKLDWSIIHNKFTDNKCELGRILKSSPRTLNTYVKELGSILSNNEAAFELGRCNSLRKKALRRQ